MTPAKVGSTAGKLAHLARGLPVEYHAHKDTRYMKPLKIVAASQTPTACRDPLGSDIVTVVSADRVFGRKISSARFGMHEFASLRLYSKREALKLLELLTDCRTHDYT